MDGYDTASPAKSPRVSQRKWTQKEKIGQGAQGTVYRCVEASTGRTIAIKEIVTDGLSDQEIDALTSEATVMKSLEHKHIIEYYGVRRKKRTLEISMEFMSGGSLSSYIRAVGGSLTLERTKQFTWQLLRAVQFLHQHRIAHRDIKSANVLLSDDQAHIKLADFGALKEIGSVSVLGGLKGTPHWMAPEVIKEQQTSEGWMKADIWSLGCTVLEMLTGKTPWNEYSNPLTAMYKIVSSDSTPVVPSDLPTEAIDFVQSCFNRDPSKRPEAINLLQSPFLKSIRKLKKKERTKVSKSPRPTSNERDLSPIHDIKPDATKRPEIDDMPKSKLLSILQHDPFQVAKPRKPKKTIKLQPIVLHSTNQEKSTPKGTKHFQNITSPESDIDSQNSPTLKVLGDLKISSPIMSPLNGTKSMPKAGFPTLKQRPELRRIATAPPSEKRLVDLSPKTLKLPPLSARGLSCDVLDFEMENNNARYRKSVRCPSKPSRGLSASQRSGSYIDEEELISKHKKNPTNHDTIVIHVCDEFRKINKDFVCNKTLLLDNMKYFKAYLNDTNTHEDIDISVHCDVSIFEWLFRYIHANERTSTPETRLAVDNVTSILISSDFLQMDFLVSECISFICQNLEQVIDMPGDLLCISDAILDKIAVMCTFEQLDAIESSKEKLCYKLYSKRLIRMLSTLKDQDDGRCIECCIHCSVVYYSGHRSFLSCPKAKLHVGIHGNIVSYHEPKHEWKVDTWIKSLTTMYSGRQAFWKVWAAVQCIYCYDCSTYFTASELNECYYHAVTDRISDDGTYSCCGAKKFAVDIRTTSGCKMKKHNYHEKDDTVQKSSDQYSMPELLDRVFQLLSTHSDIMTREIPALPDSSASKSSGTPTILHEMLQPHVKPQVSLLASCDASNELMKTIKSSQPDVSTPQTRKQWKIDLLQEKDRIRVQMLSAALTKMRTEYKIANR